MSHQFPIHVAWRRDPYSVATNPFSITWNKEFYYAFSPLCLITQVPNKIEKDKTKKINFNNTMLVDTVVLPPNIEQVDKEASNSSIIRKTTNQSFWTDSPIHPYISGMDGFRKGVSVKAANLIFNSRRQSSLSGYESSWKK